MDKLVSAFQELAEKFGSPVFDSALGAARVTAYSALASSGLWFLASGVFLFLGLRLKRKATEGYDEEPLLVLAWLIIVLAGTCFLPGLWTWVDPWTWTAINHPELWLAKQALHM